MAPPMYDPPQSQSPPSPPSESPPRPQYKRYALSDAPPVRAASPVRKLRKNQERNNSSPNLANNPPARVGAGRAASPGRTPRAKLTSDSMGRVPTPPGSETPVVPSSAGDGVPNISSPATPEPNKRPTTFAEMGFHGVKAQDKDCVIM